MAGNAADFNVGGSSREAVSALQSLMRHQAKVVDMFGTMGRSSRKAKKQFGGAFGKGALSTLKNLAGGIASVTGAIALAKKVMAELHQERKDAAARVQGSESSVRALAQLSGGDSRKYQMMLGKVTQTRIQAGVDRSTAAGLQFQLNSLGFDKEKDRRLFASLYDVTASREAPMQLARGVGKLQSAMGKGETGGARNLLNKMLVATAGSDISAEQIAIPASRVAKTVQGIGSSDEEFLASLSTMAKAQGSPEEAATRIQALSKVLTKQGLSGKGLIGGVRELQKKWGGLSRSRLQKKFGRVEAMQGYEAMLSQMPEIESLTGKLHQADRATGTSEDALAGMIGVTGYGQEADAKSARVEEQKLQVVREAEAGKQLRRNAALNKRQRLDHVAGLTGVERVMGRWHGQLQDWAGWNPEAIESGQDHFGVTREPGDVSTHATPGFKVDVKITPTQDTSNSQTE